MTKSGFYRYCLARAIGHTEEEATQMARHLGVGNFSIIEADEKPPKSRAKKTKGAP